MGVSRDCSFLGRFYPLLSQELVKLQKREILYAYSQDRSDYWNKSPLKMSGKVAVGVDRDSRKFSGQRYIGRIERLSLR